MMLGLEGVARGVATTMYKTTRMSEGWRSSDAVDVVSIICIYMEVAEDADAEVAVLPLAE